MTAGSRRLIQQLGSMRMCTVRTCVAHLIHAGIRSTHSPYAVSSRVLIFDLEATLINMASGDFCHMVTVPSHMRQ